MAESESTENNQAKCPRTITKKAEGSRAAPSKGTSARAGSASKAEQVNHTVMQQNKFLAHVQAFLDDHS
jgi:hypothetical protein